MRKKLLYATLILCVLSVSLYLLLGILKMYEINELTVLGLSIFGIFTTIVFGEIILREKEGQDDNDQKIL